jgi:hypothetical protein
MHCVAKCVNCFYELEFKQIELDTSRRGKNPQLSSEDREIKLTTTTDEGNFTTNGIAFRIRFLQKSHVATKRSDEQLYACLFCVHLGTTVDECDATIFFSQRQLFRHLAKHPRPLPAVPGLTVIEDAAIPRELTNNYDLHFKNPVEASPMADRQADIAHLPTATAKDTVKRMYGMRLLADKTPPLELAVGAKIVGVEFPAKYNGEWCMGWHDGVYASFPADVAKLDPPPQSDIKIGGTSNMRAIARWKFNNKDKEKNTNSEWLKFDKEEVITNISCKYLSAHAFDYFIFLHAH